jgi:type VI protein secretion system component VasK
LKPALMRGIDRASLTVGADTLIAASTNSPAQQFAWTGTPNQGARLTVRIAGGSADLVLASAEGVWAAFRLFSQADSLTASGSGYSMEWVVRTGKQPSTLSDGTPVSIRFDMDIKIPIFQKGYFSGLRCVPEIARP